MSYFETDRAHARPRGRVISAATMFGVLVLGLACGTPSPELVRLPDHENETTLIRHVAVLDVDSGERVLDRDVFVRDGIIAAIGIGGQLPTEASTLVVDGAGATLLPGLVDCHGHVSLDPAPAWVTPSPDPEANLRSYLYSGVTTVIDPADSSSDALERRDRVARSELLGPRIFSAGRLLTAPGGHPIALIEAAVPGWLHWLVVPGAADQVATPENARSAVRARAEEGVDFVKIVVDRIPDDTPRLGRAEIEAAADEARKLGLRSIAHIGSTQDALDTGNAGVSAWMHGVYKDRIPDAVIPELAGFGIPMVPTLVVFHNYADAADANRVPTRLERESVPAALLASFNDPPENAPIQTFFAPYLDKLRAEQPGWGSNVLRLRDAGVTILAGSDTQSGVFPGPGLHRELAYLVAAGLTPSEAIRAATLDAARLAENAPDPSFGRIAVGKRADLLLVEGDPSASIEAVSQIRDVFLAGQRLVRTPIESASAH